MVPWCVPGTPKCLVCSLGVAWLLPGKPDAVKVARPVWSGGKTVRSDLSLRATRSRVCKCNALEDSATLPVVPPTVSYPDLLPWQRGGGKLRGQRTLSPSGLAGAA